MLTPRRITRATSVSVLSLTILLVAGFAPTAFAQSGGSYEVTWSTTDGGSVKNATGGIYKAHATAGQHDTDRMTGGTYAVSGGFWVFAAACMPSSAAVLDPRVPDAGYGTRNRYLSFSGGDAGRLQAIRVTLSALPAPHNHADGRVLWVGPPVEVSENAGKTNPADAPGFPTFWAAPLQCDPYYTDWSGFPMLHVYGVETIPSGLYDVQVIDDSCGEAFEESYSTSVTFTQSGWGDLVSDCANIPCGPPDGVINVTSDVTAVLNKFKNLEGAPIKARSDLDLDLPDQKINISDVTHCLDAFRGFGYPFPGPPVVDPCGP